MSSELSGKKVAILAMDGFEQSELFTPYETLKNAGADVDIVSLKTGEIKGWNEKDWGKAIPVDVTLSEAASSNYDAIMLPGGVMNPDSLRKEKTAVAFVKDFFETGKPIAAICHAPQLLIETDFLEGRRLTSYSSIKTDLENAGAEWSDEEVVVDNGLVTSRSPEDLPAFCSKMIEEFAEGKHDKSPSVEGFTAIL